MDDLTRRFAYHPPSRPSVADHHGIARDICKDAAEMLLRLMPAEAGREKALVLTNLEEAMMWANAGIARWQ